MPTSYKFEISPNNRAGCMDKDCKETGDKILKDTLRFATWVSIPIQGNVTQSWKYKHWGCVTPKQIENVKEFMEGNFELLEGFDELDQEWQDKIKKSFEQGHIPDEDWNGDMEFNRPGMLGKRPKTPKKKATAANNDDKVDDENDEKPKKTNKSKPKKSEVENDKEDEPEKVKKSKTKKSNDDDDAERPKKAKQAKPKKENKKDDNGKDENSEAPKKKAPSKKSAVKIEAEPDEADPKNSSKPKKKSDDKTSGKAKKRGHEDDDGDIAPRPVKKGRVKQSKQTIDKEEEKSKASPPTKLSRYGRKIKA